MLTITHYIKIICLAVLLVSGCAPYAHLNQSTPTKPRRLATLDSASEMTAPQPKTYMFKSAIQGDLACYVELLSLSTQKVEHYDSGFEWCEMPELVGQKIIATFHLITVNECSSIEPCARSREVLGLKEVRIID